MDNRIKEVMAIVLQISESEINDKTSMKTLTHWDSINHISLITALEQEFAVRFNYNEMAAMVSYPIIRETVLKKLKPA
ncbi:MAG: hypothetical protein HQK88_16225 [Nitrospirae bacterium]|nr:hypothetical protein [Nitrospirota bacterium]MBF0536442.1 hypothetical protein [Nitrospirota bacterium]MBF0618347.1 hypothetical protein [Nitrospirota bacterium]